MEHVLLGRTGLRVSRLALGTAVLGLAPPEDQVDALVHAAIDHGVNLIDCANTYGNRASFDRPGMPPAAERKHAEELLGAALKGRRDEVLICTKVSEPVGSGVNDGGYGFRIPGMESHGGGLSRYHIMREVENSLRRLATDHIDIYHAHHPDRDTAIEETLAAFDDLVRQGKVRYVALSTFSAWEMTHAVMTAELRGLARPVLNQTHYNMLNRSVESDVVPAALELGLMLTCFSPLAGGALAGTEAMSRPHGGGKRFGGRVDFTPEQRDVAAQLDALGREWGHPPADLALSWLLSRPALAAAIIGPENPDELEQSVGVFDVELDPEQLARLDAVGRAAANAPF